MSRHGRGQSSIDFVVGLGVFFLTLSFVIVLLPDLLSPFAAPEGPVVADRAAETLGGELLASGTLGSLNETCTDEFFDGSGASCSFDASDSTTALLGLSDTYSVNVTLEWNGSDDTDSEIACYDGSSVRDCSNGGDRLARGDAPPDTTRSVRTASQVVRVAGETLSLTVRVW